MEKLLLVMALMGSAHLAISALAGWIRRLVEVRKPKPAAVMLPAQKPHEEAQEDWSEYEIPTFIRRGIPMPKLEPVPMKPTRTRKRRSKAKAKPAESAAQAFEVVA